MKAIPGLIGPAYGFAAETGLHALRLLGSGLFDKYPKLTLILGHLGEALPFNLSRIDQRIAWSPMGYPAKRKISEYFQQQRLHHDRGQLPHPKPDRLHPRGRSGSDPVLDRLSVRAGARSGGVVRPSFDQRGRSPQDRPPQCSRAVQDREEVVSRIDGRIEANLQCLTNGVCCCEWRLSTQLRDTWAAQYFNGIARPHVAGLDDPHVNPAQIAMPQRLRRHQAQRVGSEAGLELPAAVVRHGCDLEQRAANAETAPRRQVRRGKIQVQKQVVPEQGKRLPVGDHFGDAHLHHRDLHVRMSFRPAAPGVSGNPCIRQQLDLIQDFAPAGGTAPHDQDDPARVGRRRGETIERFLQITADSKAFRISN